MSFIGIFFFAFLFCVILTHYNFSSVDGALGMNTISAKIVIIVMIPITWVI